LSKKQDKEGREALANLLIIVYDKIISLYQGRPVSFREQDMHVPHRFLDRYEELELWTPFAFGGSYRYPGSPARAISTFTALCSLSTVLVSFCHVLFACGDAEL
jgi:hypothetical protein